MILGILLPRYGEEVRGGTEHWLRLLAEHVVERLEWQVEVFTTCATDAATWADDLASGTTTLNGVDVHRFPVVSGRDPAYLRLLPLITHDPGGTPDALADEYVSMVGPVCPDAVAAAVASGADLVAVSPYLFWPAVEAVPRIGRRVILHGAAHDEPELRLPLIRRVFESAGGFAFNSASERHLVERTFGVAHKPGAVIGNAVEQPFGDPDAARAALGLGPDERFVVCVGRVERAKGAHALADMWRLYRARQPDAPRLVFIGVVHEQLDGGDGIVVAGRQPDAITWGAMAGADVLVSPSALESFSLVVLEAWLAGTPVVVNGRCGPTVEHCRASGGGVWFDRWGDFATLMDRLLSDSALRHRLAARGAEYASARFGWEAVLDRYAALAERVAAGARR